MKPVKHKITYKTMLINVGRILKGKEEEIIPHKYYVLPFKINFEPVSYPTSTTLRVELVQLGRVRG